MPSLTSRISRFLRSPQGQKMVGDAKRMAAKPENQRKIEQLRQRIMKGRRH